MSANAESWALRQDALSLLSQFVPPADQWFKTVLSPEEDEKLAQLALSGKGQTQQAIQLLAYMKSEHAIQTLLSADVAENTTNKHSKRYSTNRWQFTPNCSNPITI